MSPSRVGWCEGESGARRAAGQDDGSGPASGVEPCFSPTSASKPSFRKTLSRLYTHSVGFRILRTLTEAAGKLVFLSTATTDEQGRR